MVGGIVCRGWHSVLGDVVGGIVCSGWQCVGVV